jgi:hypothetical protein
VRYSFTIFPELFLVMPSISSREMDTLVTPMGPCDVSIFRIFCYFFILETLLTLITNLNSALYVFVLCILKLKFRRSPVS